MENAKDHGVSIQYGSDVFAQVVLSLEDLARMVERGIYDLSTWAAGMKYLPEAKTLPGCFQALGFDRIPLTAEEVQQQFRRLAKGEHPDAGGDTEAFEALCRNRRECLAALEAKKGGEDNA